MLIDTVARRGSPGNVMGDQIMGLNLGLRRYFKGAGRERATSALIVARRLCGGAELLSHTIINKAFPW